MLAALLLTVSVYCVPATCAPWAEDAADGPPARRDDLAIAETTTSTFLQYSTSTTYVMSTTMAPLPSVADSVLTDADMPVFVLPPALLPTAVIGFNPPSSSSGPTSATPSRIAPSPSAPAPSSSAPPGAQPLVMAYYPDWAAPAFPPEKIDFGRFDWIDFAFAVPDQNFNLTWDGSDNAPDLLNRLVAGAHASNKKVKLSVGGWSGSKYFSSAVSSSQNRQTFVKNILSFYQQFTLDGIDIDWEYPSQTGNTGNIVSPDDTANFLSFLQLLRSSLPQDAKISAAVQTVPFADSQGNPMTNVSDFAGVLDWVLLMNYDTWGSSATPGPNAPLSNGCNNSTQPTANAVAAVNSWTSAGFPASQLVLGMPSYGYISRSNATRLRTRARAWHSRNRAPHRRRSVLGVANTVVSGVEDAASSAIEAVNEDGGSTNGQIQFRDLVSQGVLQYSPADANSTDSPAAPTRLAVDGHQLQSDYVGWSGFSRYWDNCSSTPFLRSPSADQVVTYDDPLSLGLKAAFAAQSGMLGVNMFDVTGDTDQWDLTDSMRSGLGLA